MLAYVVMLILGKFLLNLNSLSMLYQIDQDWWNENIEEFLKEVKR